MSRGSMGANAPGWLAWSGLSALIWLWVGGAMGQTISEQYLLIAANQERAAHRLGPLRIDVQLVQAARQHAVMMARHHEITHQFAGEAELAERAGMAGAHFSRITENVAEASNSALIHRLWMQSAGHRANLLDGAVDVVGIAVAEDRGQLYAVEDFAHAVPALTLEQQEAAVGRLLAATGLQWASGAVEARATCAMENGYVGRQPGFVMRYTASDLGRLPVELAERLATGRYREAAIGACGNGHQGAFTSYRVAVLLY